MELMAQILWAYWTTWEKNEMATVSEVLVKMAEILAPEGSWTQHVDSKDQYDRAVPSIHEDAVTWCLRGAYIKAATELGMQPTVETWASNGVCVMRALRHVLLLENVATSDPVNYNDHPHTTHEDIRLLLKKAIALTTD